MTFRSFYGYGAGAALVTTLAPAAQAAQAVLDKPVPVLGAFRNVTATGDAAKSIRLSDYAARKKAVVLVFLANRCGMTWTYTDQIAALIRDYGARPDVAIVGVHSSFEESDGEIVAQLKARHLSLPLLDDKPKQVLADTFGATVTPSFYLIDGTGVLRYRGAFDKAGGTGGAAKRPQYLRPALEAVLAGKPVTLKSTRLLGCELTRRKVAKQ